MWEVVVVPRGIFWSRASGRARLSWLIVMTMSQVQRSNWSGLRSAGLFHINCVLANRKVCQVTGLMETDQLFCRAGSGVGSLVFSRAQ